MAWACSAIRYGWLYTKALERGKFLALQKSERDFDKIMSLPIKVKSDLDWWIKNILKSHNPINEGYYKIVIFSDASRSGWGVCCQEERTRVWWLPKELKEHINYLELKAAFYGLKCFVKDLRACNILLRVNNTTAISHINRMGSVQFPKLSALCSEIWQWCEM